MDRALLWLDPQKLKLSKCPGFYLNLFKVWALFKIPEERTVNSLYWLLHEPLIFGSRLALSSELSYFVTEVNLLNSGLLTIGQSLQVAGANFIDVSSVTEKLGMRSTRLVARGLDKWKTALSEKELKLLLDYSLGFIHPDCTDYFPDLYLTPIMDNCGGGCFLEVNRLIVMGSDVTSGKVCYKICVKIFNKKALDKKNDTPWRGVLHVKESEKPEWRVLYKSPLSKRIGDLQWRLLHDAIAVNAFVSVINSDVDQNCSFCSQKETVFHAFMQCSRLCSSVIVLNNIFNCFNECFSMKVFICGFKYSQSHKYQCQLFNFILGHAKMAIYTTRIEKNDHGVCNDLKTVFTNSVKSKILIDFNYYEVMNDCAKFELIWCLKGDLCEIIDELFFSYLNFCILFFD